MTKKDIAIIGGTFNPVHNGHIAMAKYLSENYIVDEIWFLPSFNPPHKNNDDIVSYYDRIEMLKIAARDLKRTIISNYEEIYFNDRFIELKKQDKFATFDSAKLNIKTYTYNILNDILKKNKNVIIHFIVGFDSMKYINTWFNYKELLKEFEFYIYDRVDDEFLTMEHKKIYLDNLVKKDGYRFYYEFLNENIPNISSTEIRNLLKNDGSNEQEILKYIDGGVYKYIIDNNLYT